MMPVRALLADEVAAELGRSLDWLYRNRHRLVRERKFPAPILEGDRGELAWSAAQVYAWLDRDLTPPQRAAAAAYRAAAAAYVDARRDPGTTATIVRDAADLDRQFAHHKETT